MTTNNPSVSFIVPVYNAGGLLDKCVDSILTQTCGDFEVVLVDDGSTDGSGDKCDRYAENDSRVVVVHKKNAGVAAARLTGFSTSKAPWVSFVDADDYLAPEFLQKMLEAGKKYDADLVSCRYYNCKYGKTPTSATRVTGFLKRDGLDEVLKNKFLYDRNTRAAGIPIALWAKLIKREFVEPGLLAGQGLKWSEDSTGLFYMLKNINSLCAIPDPLYFYVQHQGQVTKKYNFELWENQFEAYRRFKSIDTNNLIDEQLFIRYWIFVVRAITQKRMPKVLTGRAAFCKEMRKVEKLPSWKEFINSRMTTTLGWKEDVLFWLLRLRQYSLYYQFFVKRR